MDENTRYFKELLPGTTLNGGKYVIEKKIGEGGFGITYKAVQAGLNRAVCIKEYFLAGYCVRNAYDNYVQLQGLDPNSYEKYRQAFAHEAQTLAELHHPNIVEIIDVFHENNTSYMVMPFIEGRTLQSIVENNGHLSYPDAVNYITQIANAVGYIHERHILHRDIKPANIMITAGYKAILIDFGSAREFVEDKTQSHTSMLTHGYAPTEQYTRNSRKGSYTDIYALGATLYFTLTGKVPVEAAARISEPMPEPKELNHTLPYEANYTIMKAMQLKSADRYQNVKDFLDDLLNRKAKTPPVMPPPHTVRTTPPPNFRVTPPPNDPHDKWKVWVVAAITILIIAVISLIINNISSNKPDYVADTTYYEEPAEVIEIPVETPSEEPSTYTQTDDFPDDDRVKDVLGSYCQAIADDDFDLLSSLYAPYVERFHNDSNGISREEVVQDHRNYDKKFKVYGKHSSIRWGTFEIENVDYDRERVKAIIVEDYSIDREDKSKWSVFVLEKHFTLDHNYQIVRVWDKQLSHK